MKRKKIKSKTKLSEMYSKYGAGALRDRANKSGHKYWTFCDQCDSETPALRDMSCLMCGSTSDRGLRRNAGSKSKCDMVTDTDWEDKENTLVFEKNLSPVCVGQKVRSRESYIVSGGRAPHKPSSSGRVYVKTIGGDRMGREFFPTVFKMKWIPSYNLYPVDKMSMQPRLKINRKRGLRRNSAPDSNSIKKLIEDLALDFSPVVKDIESSPYPTTQNNYGRYMSLINSMSKGDKRRSEIIAMALITAGANRSGVKSALRVMFGE